MFKLLIAGPLLLVAAPVLLVAGAVALALVAPLLALVPIALAFGAAILGIAIAMMLIGLVIRLALGLVVGAGALLALVFGIGFFLFAGSMFVAIGALFAHLLLPLLVIAALVWLIRRASRPAPPALPSPQV
jgi:hypothetical protein